MKTELLRADAQTHLAIWVHCPYCDQYQNAFETLRECLPQSDFELRAEDCDKEVECEECKKVFIVDNIYY